MIFDMVSKNFVSLDRTFASLADQGRNCAPQEEETAPDCCLITDHTRVTVQEETKERSYMKESTAWKI
jgi:hypothetical protein